MIYEKYFPLMLAAAVLASSQAQATKTVTSPYVSKGRVSAEIRSGYEINEDEENGWSVRNQVSYGLTDYYEAKVSLNAENYGDTELTDIDLENKFQLVPKGEYWIDTGIRLDYARSLNGGPDEVGGKLLFGKDIGPVSQLLNLEIGHEIGEDSEQDFAYGVSYMAAYAISDELDVGAEYYGDFGNFGEDFEDQEHLAGPVVYGSALGLKYQLGVLAGLSDRSPDALIKSVIRYDF